ncbi:hypothetical protein DRO38_05480 [Candidatus Bathyarchaeota archaeon]|nr:MAG: hypothetical protein DRO38_05480 [Candidatus Bathyarchaeota archaeon]
MKAEEMERRIEEVNRRIVEKIEVVRERGKKEMPKIRTAREYFCDAVALATEKRLEEASYKLSQALEVLKGVE